MKVFVAGASGAIGRPLVRQLLAAGQEVTGMTRREENAAAIQARSQSQGRAGTDQPLAQRGHAQPDRGGEGGGSAPLDRRERLFPLRARGRLGEGRGRAGRR